MLETALQATLIDSVNTITWLLCGGNAAMDRPPSIFDILTSNTKKQEKELRSYASGAAFLDAWSKGD